MHGIIFVTWEKYLGERFNKAVFQEYRAALGEIPPGFPLANRVYNDADLLTGVGTVNRMTGVDVDTLLREYGYYFIMNGLTRHSCAYLLNQVHNGRDLLLTMSGALARQEVQHQFADLILSILPYKIGLTLDELQNKLRHMGFSSQQCRPVILLRALTHLHHAGLVANTANQEGDDLTIRRYWRVPTLG